MLLLVLRRKTHTKRKFNKTQGAEVPHNFNGVKMNKILEEISSELKTLTPQQINLLAGLSGISTQTIRTLMENAEGNNPKVDTLTKIREALSKMEV